MKVLIAPLSFKGTLPSFQVANAMAEAVSAILPQAEITMMPMGDGGDGTLDVLIASTKGTYRRSIVTGPLGKPIDAEWGIMGDSTTVVVESARICGLALLKPEYRNPLHTTSAGIGEIINQALSEGYRKFYIGLGGTATNDIGAGLLQSLGVRFLDNSLKDIQSGSIGLSSLDRVELNNLNPRIRQASIYALCDVVNPLVGPSGATLVYGPQKGGDSKTLGIIEKNVNIAAQLLQQFTHTDIFRMPMGGAAGGSAAGIVSVLGGMLLPGAQAIADIVELPIKARDASLIITGEGRIDSQTAYNKGPLVIAQIGKQFGIPVLGIGGSLTTGYRTLYAQGFTLMTGLVSHGVSPDYAMQRTSDAIEKSTRRLLKRWLQL